MVSNLKIGVRSQESGVRGQGLGEISFHPFVVNSHSWMSNLKIGSQESGVRSQEKRLSFLRGELSFHGA